MGLGQWKGTQSDGASGVTCAGGAPSRIAFGLTHCAISSGTPSLLRSQKLWTKRTTLVRPRVPESELESELASEVSMSTARSKAPARSERCTAPSDGPGSSEKGGDQSLAVRPAPTLLALAPGLLGAEMGPAPSPRKAPVSVTTRTAIRCLEPRSTE